MNETISPMYSIKDYGWTLGEYYTTLQLLRNQNFHKPVIRIANWGALFRIVSTMSQLGHIHMRTPAPSIGGSHITFLKLRNWKREHSHPFHMYVLNSIFSNLFTHIWFPTERGQNRAFWNRKLQEIWWLSIAHQKSWISILQAFDGMFIIEK